MSGLTLFAPGLVGPWPEDADPRPVPHAPALRRILSRGDVLPRAPLAFEEALARLFGLEGAPLPWGALGLWGETGQRPEGFILRADPVHLRLGMTEGIVLGGPALGLGMEEAQGFAQALEAHFADRGWRISVAAPERWYLRLERPADLYGVPLHRALRRDAGLFKPTGRDASRWLADLTEAQMLLHEHPLNAAREARGLPAIHALWPWGAGSLSFMTASHPYSRMYASHPLARGLGHALGLAVHDLPERFEQVLLEGRPLIVLDAPWQPWLSGDISGWMAALQGLETQWFAPLHQALRRGRVRELQIDAAEGGLLRITPRHAWRIGRRDRRWEVLCARIA